MSAYSRRAPNVSQYIADLNTISSPSQQDQHSLNADLSAFDDDLALFANTSFFDFDMHEAGPVPDVGDKVADVPAETTAPPQQQLPDDFAAFTQSLGQSSTGPPPTLAPLDVTSPTSPTDMQLLSALAATPTTATPTTSTAHDEHSRQAADEDKRRRNTAASARFRVKKKQREQALEKSAKDLSDKVKVLEARVNQLEMENDWLKGLITEKNKPSGAATKSE